VAEEVREAAEQASGHGTAFLELRILAAANGIINYRVPPAVEGRVAAGRESS
jgi:hypothetical protein